MFLRRALFAPVLLTLIACGDDDGAGGSGAGTEQGGGGEAPGCSGVCLVIPEGFEGPIEIHDSGVAACTNQRFSGGYVDDAFTAPPAVCGCACGAPDAACEYEATVHENSDCSGSSLALDTTVGACLEVDELGVPARGLQLAATPSGTCASDGAAAILPALQFDPEVDGCGVNLDACEEGGTDLCFPVSVKTYCVYSETATECPAGFTDQRRVIRPEDMTDTRDCSCDCEPGDVSCEPTVELGTDTMCTAALDEAATGDCWAGPAGEAFLGVELTDGVVADCGEPTQAASGTVEVAGEGVLVCCVPE